MNDAQNLNFDFTDPALLTRLIGIAVPLLVALLSKKVSSGGLKATLNVALSAIGGSVAYLTSAEGDLDFAGYVNAVLNTFTTGIIAYYGFLKPTGISDTITEKTAGFGIGSPPAPELETADKGATEEGEAEAEAVAAAEELPFEPEEPEVVEEVAPPAPTKSTIRRVPVKRTPIPPRE